jgi:cell division topological specificity factor
VIRKYVNVDSDAVDIQVKRDGDHEVLDLTVTLPDKASATATAAAREA